MWALITNKWVLGAVVVAGLGLALYVQTERLDAAKKAEEAATLTAQQWRANFESAEATNAANVRALEKLKAEQAAANEAAAEQIAKYNRLGKLYEDLKRQPRDETPLSNSWRALFNSLHRIEDAARAPRSDGNPN